jgi:glycosyltransferase involved in cell wall biosynthesis
MHPYFVSIIIPTYNDWIRLSKCLNALADQSYPNENFEIIVVNNNPDDHIPDGYFLPNNCSIITKKEPGSYAARNAALKLAKGEIIGFTDSDCIPDKNWISNAINYFINNKLCSRIAGRICVFFETPNPTNAQLYDKLYAFNQKGYVDKSGTSVTANLFTYKYVFDKVGYFNESLMSGGDFLWGTKAHENGYRVDYVEEVIVRHPARENFKALVKKERRVGGSQAIFLKANHSMLMNILYFLKNILPHVSELKFIYSKAKGLSPLSKVSIFFLRHYLLSIRAYEKLRVQMGKKPNRS